MIELLSSGDTIIAPSAIKKQILLELTASHKLLNIKFFTKEEFLNNFYGTYTKKSLYFLIKQYNLNYQVATVYLSNLFYHYSFLQDIYDTLLANNYLVFNPNFKESLKHVVIIGYDLLDPYLKKDLEPFHPTYLALPKEHFNPVIFGFDKQIDEITYIAIDILKKLPNHSLNDFYLVNVNDNYLRDIKRIFKLFHLPINITSSKNIYGTIPLSTFLHTLESTNNLEASLSSIEAGEIKNKIIDIINAYNFISDIDQTYITIIKEELKRATISIPILDPAINVIPISSMLDKEKYYYLIGFNQGSVPTIIHDDELIKDNTRLNLGLATSLDKLLASKEKITSLIYSFPNLTISYKLKDYYNTYYPSSLITEYHLPVTLNPSITYNYSHSYNQLELASSLDKYYKYNETSSNLASLLHTYQSLPYLTYDNQYHSINFQDLLSYLNHKTNLSYSSMNNYFLCSFRFYIENILKLDPFEDTFAAFIGSLFHDCLSHMYDHDFNLEKNYQSYLTKRELTNKEAFFCSKLYHNLAFIIDTIHYQEQYSKFNQVLTEQHLSIQKNGELNVNFLGFVDKIKYLEQDGKMLLAIIDYKTGSVETTLDNINYGLHLQLPVYIYLTKEGLHKNIAITGFYLQHILNNDPMDSSDLLKDMQQKLRLEGYTIDDENIINLFDSTYEHSEVIKGMALTSNGFSQYTKLITPDHIDFISTLVNDKINETIKAIYDVDFKINPKRIDNVLVGCEYCRFKDLCYLREENIVDLKNTKFKDLIGGEGNA